MTSDELLLGIDAGHTVAKAVLIDIEGHQIAIGQALVPHVESDGIWQELDMQQLWTAVAESMRRCLVGIDPRRVRGIGICGHSDGLYVFTADAQPVRPAILATDSRAQTEAELLAETVGEELLGSIGQVLFPASPGAILRWLIENEPKTLATADHIGNCKDWLRFKLSGSVGTDISDASGSFADLRTHDWSETALRLTGVSDFSYLLTPISLSSSVIGAVTAEAAAMTGLCEGTPVVAGAHDVHAAMLGVGAVAEGAISMVMGTWSINQVITNYPRPDPRWHTRASLEAGRWLHMSTSPASASNVNWVVSTLGWEVSHLAELVPTAVARLFRDPALPVFLPYLFGAPAGTNPGARFINLRGWHRREDLLAAVIAGVAFNHRHHLDMLGERIDMTDPIHLTGGAARNVAWCQLIADTTQREVVRSDTEESGARGSALLAGIGVGIFASIDDAAARATRIADRFTPDQRRGERLDPIYKAYRVAASAATGV